MKKSLFFIGVFATFVVFNLPPAEALYQFDDLYKPSGVGAQWMVLTGTNDTIGGGTMNDKAINPLVVSGEITEARRSVKVINDGERYTTEKMGSDQRDVHTMFLVIPENSGSMTVDFYYPDAPDEAVTVDVLNGLESYPTEKVTAGDVKDYGSHGKRFTLNLVKDKNAGKYGSENGYFILHQNPRSTPSQTLDVPFIVANVRDSTAQYEPLILRMMLRDRVTGKKGDIVAYDAFKWDVTGDKVDGGAQWVLVPVDEWPINDKKIYYSLTTEVTNHTAVRYAVQRYDDYAWYDTTPMYWKFDLPRLLDYGDIYPTSQAYFQLDEKSHIAPGLTTVYRERYNVNESMKTPLHLYCVDPAGSPQTLTLNHRVLFGLNLGLAEGSSGTNSPAPYRAQAFNPRTASTSFLENVAKKMNASAVNVPDTANFFNQSSIGDEYVSGGVITSFHVKQSVPSSLRRNGEGMLPLHVTFNLPKTNSQVAPHWNEMLTQWHDTGNVDSLFSKYFSVYLLSRKDGETDNPWNMIQELEKLGAYDEQVKVFMDEDRNVITVSFIVMLMDGTRDGSRPALYLVEDTSVATTNQFMIVRDGHADNTWNMTFYVGPAGYTENNGGSGSGSGGGSSGSPSGGGGGGCSAGFGAVCLGLLAVYGMMRGRVKK